MAIKYFWIDASFNMRDDVIAEALSERFNECVIVNEVPNFNIRDKFEGFMLGNGINKSTLEKDKDYIYKTIEVERLFECWQAAIELCKG